MKVYLRWLLAVTLAVLAILLAVPQFPIAQTLRQSPDQAELKLTLDQRWVLLPAYCVTYRWELEGIAGVYFDDQPTTGNDQREACFTAKRNTAPDLRVELRDGERVHLQLMPVVLGTNPIYVTAISGLMVAAVTISLGLIDVALVLRGVQIAVVWIVITALMLEGGFRLWIGLTGTDTDKLIYTGSVAEIAGQQRDFVEMPYLNFGLNPRLDDVNDLGFRGEELTSIEKPDGVFRILALGGSTTYGWQIEDEESYPAQLERILQADDPQIEVINGGVPSYTTWNTLSNLAFRGVELEPDIAVIYHGWNDVGMTLLTTPDCYRNQNINMGLGNATDWVYEVPDLSWSAFIRYYTINRGIVPNPVERRADAVWGEGVSDCDTNIQRYTKQELLERNGTRYYERNLRTLVAISREFDIQPVLMTFAVDNGMLVIDPHLVGIRMFNDTLRDIATEENIPLLDLADILRERDNLWQADAHHFTAEGAALQAEIVAGFLADEGLLPTR